MRLVQSLFFMLMLAGFSHIVNAEPLPPTNDSSCRLGYLDKGKDSYIEFRYKEQAPPKNPFFFQQVVRYFPAGDNKISALIAQLPDGNLNALVPNLNSQVKDKKAAAEAEMLNLELLFSLCLMEKKLISVQLENFILKRSIPLIFEDAYKEGLQKGTAKAEEMFIGGYVAGLVTAVKIVNDRLSKPNDNNSLRPDAAGFMSNEGAYTTRDREAELRGSGAPDKSAGQTQ